MIKYFKKFIPEYTKGSILSVFQSSHDEEFDNVKGKKKIIITLAGFYQNLGDMALTYSQKKFLQENFPEYKVIVMSSHDTYLRTKALKKACTKDDIITIIGGGNMDDLYISLEDARRFIIRNFPKNKIISFPQTIAFSKSKFGKKRLKKSIRTYSRHRNLTLFAREKSSYDYMKKYFPKNNVYLVPDIVLYLNESEPAYKREGAMICFRDDLEKSKNQPDIDEIERLLKKYFSHVEITDTVNVTLEDCNKNNYENTLKVFWDKLRKMQLIVTDRLHCMIFCVITKTPCIVFPNSNQKITGTYQKWLKNHKNICLMNHFDITEAEDLISKLNESFTKQEIKCELIDDYEALIQSIHINKNRDRKLDE